MWLPDDGYMWTETCWSSFYNFNYFNNLRILSFVCISWAIKCLTKILTLNFQHPSENFPIQYNNILRDHFSKPDYSIAVQTGSFSNMGFNQLTVQTHSFVKNKSNYDCSRTAMRVVYHTWVFCLYSVSRITRGVYPHKKKKMLRCCGHTRLVM